VDDPGGNVNCFKQCLSFNILEICGSKLLLCVVMVLMGEQGLAAAQTTYSFGPK